MFALFESSGGEVLLHLSTFWGENPTRDRRLLSEARRSDFRPPPPQKRKKEQEIARWRIKGRKEGGEGGRGVTEVAKVLKKMYLRKSKVWKLNYTSIQAQNQVQIKAKSDFKS